jgi:23S rRNA (pseudouridine1915-N3)-methyltransferase
MKIELFAIGTKMPAWVQTGFSDYQTRLPKECELILTELPMTPRTKTGNPTLWKEKDSETLLKAIPSQSLVIALDERGKSYTSEQLADKLQQWRESTQHLSLLIGGPDGLSKQCQARAQSLWSLSELTLPHPLVRIIVAEQLYRAWTLLNDHPYHRA